MPEIEPFDQFLARTAAAEVGSYLGRLRALPSNANRDESALQGEFARMKDYIHTLYQGIKPVATILDAGGHIIDFIPFDQQPAVQAARHAGIDVPNQMPTPPNLGGSQAATAPSPGLSCPPSGTVPMRRITLEDLTASGTLENFFTKAKGSIIHESHE